MSNTTGISAASVNSISAIHDNTRERFVAQELIVRFKPGTDKASTLAESLGMEILTAFTPSTGNRQDNLPNEQLEDINKADESPILHVKIAAGRSVEDAMATLSASGEIMYVERNRVMYLDEFLVKEEEGNQREVVKTTVRRDTFDTTSTPSEEKMPNEIESGADMWGLVNKGQKGGTEGMDINALEAWQTITDTSEIKVGLLDTGVDFNHRDLKGNIWTNEGEKADGQDTDGNGVVDDLNGYNAYADTGNPMDGHGHGTHCAGSQAAMGNNGIDVVGVAWKAKIIPIKIFSDSGSTNSAAILRGIAYATKMGADITSNSWGGGGASQATKDMFAAATNTLHFAAAGNSNRNVDLRPNYPSGYDIPNMVAVAADDREGKRAYFSNYGKTTVDVTAPGRDILSTYPNNKTEELSGTSMSTPHVAQIGAMIYAAWVKANNGKKPTPEQAKDILFSTARQHGDYTAHGFVNAGAAVKKASIPQPPPENPEAQA